MDERINLLRKGENSYEEKRSASLDYSFIS